jgi:hypothetical protein
MFLAGAQYCSCSWQPQLEKMTDKFEIFLERLYKVMKVYIFAMTVTLMS